MKNLALISSIFFIFTVHEVLSQDRLPAREFTDPGEFIILSQDVSFAQALDIIEDISVEFRNKIFINNASYTGSIGIDIPQMHWEDALMSIAAHNNMYVTESPRYFEIRDVPPDGIFTEEVQERRASTADKFIHFGTREIEISATFFQGDRSTIRQLGIDWSSLLDDRVQVRNLGATAVSLDIFEVETSWTDIFNSGWDINALFRAFETNNKGEILSSPTIKVMDGELGSIQVGQDFSIKQRDFAGNVTDRFFNTGTILQVEPTIFYHEGTPFIYMTVRAERSTAQPDPVSTIVNKQEASTEVLLLSGESTVIAGLYETEVQRTRRGIPILKDLPGWFFGLKYLFGSDSHENVVQELVVLLKATLVPSLEERLAAPHLSRPELLEGQRNIFQQEILEYQQEVHRE